MYLHSLAIKLTKLMVSGAVATVEPPVPQPEAEPEAEREAEPAVERVVEPVREVLPDPIPELQPVRQPISAAEAVLAGMSLRDKVAQLMMTVVLGDFTPGQRAPAAGAARPPVLRP